MKGLPQDSQPSETPCDEHCITRPAEVEHLRRDGDPRGGAMQLTVITNGSGRVLYNHPLPYLAGSARAARRVNESPKVGVRLATTGLLEQRI